MLFRSQALLGVLAVSFALSASAQDQKVQPVRIRGTVEANDSQILSIATRDGKHQTLALTDATGYSAVKAMKLTDIKKGSFIGVAGRPGDNDKIEALEVVVFPEAARGTGEGHRAWDLLPDSSMTNATVSAVVSRRAGRDLTLVYKGGKAKINVPKDAPVVTIVPAKLSDLKTGLSVFITAAPSDGGHFTATRVVMEKDGVKPPM